MDTNFQALVVERTGEKSFSRKIIERRLRDLPESELLIRVRYSSLNYKDALSATGHPGVTRNFPHTPGIDAAGEVIEDASGRFRPGDQVVVTGFDLGMETDGGWGQFIRIPAEWGVPLPSGLTPREAMALGTAGLTAGLSVLKLEQAGVKPEAGEILVTGASGGVGSFAVAILARAGYRVVAATGKTGEEGYLRELGAAGVIGRDEVMKGSDQPMLKERWGGGVDVAGGEMLSAAVKATRYGGAVACCGLVGSADLPLNVYPFILRGVGLLGVDSVKCPMELRVAVWEKLAGIWKPQQIEKTVTEIGLAGLEEKIDAILQGKVRGRTVVRLPD